MAIPKFKNETYVDFSKPVNAKKQEAALAQLRTLLNKEYPIVIGSENVVLGQKFNSYNPSRPSEVVGVFQKGDAAVAHRAMETALAAFETWRSVPAEKRARKTPVSKQPNRSSR